MKTRFVLVMTLAFFAFCALGVAAPDMATLLLGILVLGLAMVAALSFYVLQGEAPKDFGAEHALPSAANTTDFAFMEAWLKSAQAKGTEIVPIQTSALS